MHWRAARPTATPYSTAGQRHGNVYRQVLSKKSKIAEDCTGTIPYESPVEARMAGSELSGGKPRGAIIIVRCQGRTMTGIRATDRA
jgi:hypothetical protein